MTHTHQARPGRSAHDAQEAKAARKAEIETRCMALDPPIAPEVLRHMESFQAATHISAPLTDHAWAVLEPRLQFQREAAERMEADHKANMLALQAKIEYERNRHANKKEVKEAQEQHWEEVQAPIRQRLSRYADEIIRQKWAKGKAVNKENSVKFAADVLTHVRERFYSEISRADQEAIAAGRRIKQDSSNGPPTRKLILENMKHVFDSKIKPCTDPYRKELFYCAGEGCEGNRKLYGFEGIIQHFGAKHTSAFSMGNVIVHWQSAEWPEDPPFMTEPSNGKISIGTASSPFSHIAAISMSGQQYGGFNRGTTTTPQVAPQGPFSVPLQTSPGAAFYANGPYPPPSAPSNGYQWPMQAHVANSYAFDVGQGNNASFRSYNHQLPFPSSPAFTHSAIPPVSGASLSVTSSQVPMPSNYGAGGRHVLPDLVAVQSDPKAEPGANGKTNGVTSGAHTSKSFAMDEMPDFQLHQDQVKELAESCRILWMKIPDVMNIPASVRAFAVIHHAQSKFKSRFNYQANLDLFTEALMNNFSMQPLKSVEGLACKMCLADLAQSEDQSVESLRFTLTSLVSHFKEAHAGKPKSTVITHGDASPPSFTNWTTDMVALPPDEDVAALVNVPGMNDERLRFVADAFPALLPKRIPPSGKRRRSEDEDVLRPARHAKGKRKKGMPYEITEPRDTSDTPLVQDEHLEPVTGVRLASYDPLRRSPLSLPPVGDNEYDPRRPALESETQYARPHHRHASPRLQEEGDYLESRRFVRYLLSSSPHRFR